MSTQDDLFDKFLNKINPDSTAIKYAKKAHESVRECLEKQDKFSEHVIDTFLYGSYKRHTAVGDIKDVDIVVLTDFDPGEDTPERVLRQLKAALARCYDDPENPQYQRRSIRIDDPLPDDPDVLMTLDIIPAAIVGDKNSALRVPDREVKEWVWSHPREHLDHTTQLNEKCNQKYVPLVKIMKWWWKYQCEIRQPDVERPKPKGFWVECLTGEMVNPKQSAWADHFITVLENIVANYQGVSQVPELEDPGLPRETIKTSMTLAEFDVFMEAVSDSLQLARAARDEVDELKSSEMWAEIFGEEFPIYEGKENKSTGFPEPDIPLGDSSHAEVPAWKTRLGRDGKVPIRASLYTEDKEVRHRRINTRGSVGSGYLIEFTARTKVREPYEVYWQVVNTGAHAQQESDLRGELKKNADTDNPLVRWEHTKYTGKHWIQCFIVKDGVCVGRSKKFFVNIRNPNFL